MYKKKEKKGQEKTQEQIIDDPWQKHINNFLKILQARYFLTMISKKY